MATDDRYMQATPELQALRTKEAWDRIFDLWSENINNSDGLLTAPMRQCEGGAQAEEDISMLWRDAATMAVAVRVFMFVAGA